MGVSHPSGSGSVALDELEKGAVLAARLLVLVEEREPLLVELRELLVPGDRFEGLLAGAPGEVDAKHTDAIARPSDRRGPAPAGLDPAPNLFVVRGEPLGHAWVHRPTGGR